MNFAQNRNLLQALGVLGDEPTAEAEHVTDTSVDWDGGPREPVPAPSDPMAEHNETLLQAIYSLPPRGWGGGGEW